MIMPSYDISQLTAAMVCPARGLFLRKGEPPGVVTELDIYFDAVEHAVHALTTKEFTTTSVRDTWSSVVRKYNMESRLNQASYNALVGRGTAVLATYAETVLSHNVTRGRVTKLKVCKFSVSQEQAAIFTTNGEHIHVVLIRDYGKHDMIRYSNHPVRIFYRLLNIPYRMFDCYSGKLSGVIRQGALKNDVRILEALVTQLEKEIAYPRRGPDCGGCNYMNKCKEIYS